MEKKRYIEAKLEVIELENEDIVLINSERLAGETEEDF